MPLQENKAVQSFRFSRSDEKPLRIEMESERLYLISYCGKDFGDCLALYGDKNLSKYFDNGKPKTFEEVEQLVEMRGLQYFRKGVPFGLFSLFEKNKMAFVGQVDLLPTEYPGEAEIGYIVRSEYQNQGFCSEAIRTLVKFVFEINLKYPDLIIHKLIATVHPENAASKRVLEKIGMKYQESMIRFGNPRLLYSIDLF